MPTESKPNQQAETKSTPTPKGDLLPAAESSDPTVQQLLAERDAAASNKDEAAAKDIAKRLAELGYE